MKAVENMAPKVVICADMALEPMLKIMKPMMVLTGRLLLQEQADKGDDAHNQRCVPHLHEECVQHVIILPMKLRVLPLVWCVVLPSYVFATCGAPRPCARQATREASRGSRSCRRGS